MRYLALMLLGFSLMGAVAVEGDPDIIYAAPGDSYLNLFGPDWQRVFERNDGVAFYYRGRLTVSPEKLVVGQRLIIPPGTFLMERAKERLAVARELRKSARRAIALAEARSSIPPGTEAYRTGMALLTRAKTEMREISYTLENYREARALAEHACASFLSYRPPEAPPRNWFWALSGLIAVATGIISVSFYAKKRRRTAAITRWLEGHQKRVKTLLHHQIQMEVCNGSDHTRR